MYYPKIQSEKSDSTDGFTRSFRTLALLEMHLGQGVQDGGATFQYNILVFFCQLLQSQGVLPGPGGPGHLRLYAVQGGDGKAGRQIKRHAPRMPSVETF